MDNDPNPRPETGRDVRWWRLGGTLLIAAGVIFLIAGNVGFAIAFLAIGGAMVALAPSLP